MSAFEDTVRNRMKHQLNQLIAKPEPEPSDWSNALRLSLYKKQV